MACKLALQIFSNSVASAIKTCVHTKEIKSLTALDTADFLLELNNTFDSCNSQQLNDKNPNRRPMSVQNRQIFENINKTISTFKLAKKICHKNNVILVPPCFTGMILSLTALIQLFEKENKNILELSDRKTFFLFTGRLNQDPLENMFSIVRQKNGYNRNPTARLFRTCFASICSFTLMKTSEKCNCENDDDKSLTVDLLSDINIEKKINDQLTDKNEDTPIFESLSDCSSSSSSSPILINKLLPVFLEECSILYFAGYLAKRCIDNFKCQNCELSIIEQDILDDPNQLLITFKTFGNISNPNTQGLKKPSNYLVTLCKIGLNTFARVFNDIKSEKRLVYQMLQIILKDINTKYLEFEQSECKDHYIFMLKLLLVTRIYKECKYLSDDEKTYKQTNKIPAKLRILTNK
jgi:hypothetical protein